MADVQVPAGLGGEARHHLPHPGVFQLDVERAGRLGRLVLRSLAGCSRGRGLLAAKLVQHTREHWLSGAEIVPAQQVGTLAPLRDHCKLGRACETAPEGNIRERHVVTHKGGAKCQHGVHISARRRQPRAGRQHGQEVQPLVHLGGREGVAAVEPSRTARACKVPKYGNHASQLVSVRKCEHRNSVLWQVGIWLGGDVNPSHLCSC
mmetsp:Transcript_45127/g.86311  ORF Transcript_45127/g.86311 Transcript_45127/m.86311 type:complete len:206 (-) Transcript_45127:159-776(-)